ncbi:uncharacterized protein LOC133467552 [Phyllopteryx taeniolatus]|uniref:uncharacterized protein LOC133467552 n=1 Tax=Phyllopteryx taeniolatus TaxID=161469 RepID=UPI002AD26D1E|nr:uncharacterized protein LOC133467552 [Phyllopteryx taeniolatus]
MSEITKDVGLTRDGALADLISAESGHAVLEKSLPDCVKEISQHLERQNPKGPTEVDSDSGDSLFLTQEPVPQAARAVRRRKSSQRTYATEGEDSGGITSSAQRHDDNHEMSTNKKKQKLKLPNYNFSFLTESWHRGTHLIKRHNIRLHNYVTGGFFKCVKLWQGTNHFWMPLPTVDQDDEDISPLTQDGEDKSSHEDIKVVDKKCFLAKSKTKQQQPWCTPPRGTKQWKHQQEGGVVTQEREKIVEISSMSNELKYQLPTSSMPLVEDGNDAVCSSSTCNIPAVLGNNEPLRNNMVQIQTPRSKRIPIPEERQELVDAETTNKCVLFKKQSNASREGSDQQSRQEEVEGVAATSVTVETTDENALALDENRRDNFLHVANTPMPEDSVADGDLASVKKTRDDEQVNSQLDLSVKENAAFSLSHNDFTEKTERGEVEELFCAVSEPLNDNRQGGKKKKKRSRHKPGSLDITADPQETDKRKHKKIVDTAQEDNNSGKSSSDAARLSRSTRKTKKRSSVTDIFDTLDETQRVADETKKTTEDKEVQLVSKKKKKKSGRMIPEDDELVSEREKKTNGTSSFLVADVEESSALEADSHFRFKKKKKKSASYESTGDFEGASSNCALPETIEVGLGGKKRRTDSQVARKESADGSGHLKPGEHKLKTKKNKNKGWLHRQTVGTSPVETGESENSTVTPYKKKKRASLSPNQARCTASDKETPNMPKDNPLDDLKDKKKKKKKKRKRQHGSLLRLMRGSCLKRLSSIKGQRRKEIHQHPIRY